MTGYSFQGMFAPAVERLEKRQTVRGNRKRHARPGEAIQLYTGMRTKACRKLVDPDPICTACDPVHIIISARDGGMIEAISVKGIALDDAAIEAFAVADGFGGFAMPARTAMGRWFAGNHPLGNFHGVVLKWEPST